MKFKRFNIKTLKCLKEAERFKTQLENKGYKIKINGGLFSVDIWGF